MNLYISIRHALVIILSIIFIRIWISPRCPKMPVSSSSSDGDSSTKFRSDMIQYLSTYPVQATRAWIDIIKGVDCSEIK